jgi:hypothetical protein
VPSRQQHLVKAESNQRLAIAFQNGPHVDWSVTVLFYAALHLVEAALAPAVHSPNHSARHQTVQVDPRFQQIYRHYRELYYRSLDARYDCVFFSILQAQHLYVTSYEPIKRHLQPLLGLTF